MTQHLDADELIERARAALSPHDADQARVLTALSERLFPPGGGAPAHGNRADPADASRVLRAARLQPAPGLLRVRGLMGWLWKGSLPLAAAGALGVLLASPRTQHAPQGSQPRAVLGSAALQVPAAAAPAAPTVVGDAAQTVPPTAAPAEPDKPKKPARKKCRAANGSERPCASRPAPTALARAEAAPDGAAPATPAAPSLRMELDALRSAERALREQRPRAALEALEALERAAAGGGAMREEREAAATMARCALAAIGGKALGEQFAQRYPGSAYTARVHQSCRH